MPILKKIKQNVQVCLTILLVFILTFILLIPRKHNVEKFIDNTYIMDGDTPGSLYKRVGNYRRYISLRDQDNSKHVFGNSYLNNLLIMKKCIKLSGTLNKIIDNKYKVVMVSSFKDLENLILQDLIDIKSSKNNFPLQNIYGVLITQVPYIRNGFNDVIPLTSHNNSGNDANNYQPYINPNNIINQTLMYAYRIYNTSTDSSYLNNIMNPKNISYDEQCYIRGINTSHNDYKFGGCASLQTPLSTSSIPDSNQYTSKCSNTKDSENLTYLIAYDININYLNNQILPV